MKKRTQNPIYIATTISVYLGLVLVGASPAIFAQIAAVSEDQTPESRPFKCPNDGLIAGEKESDLNPLSYDLAGRFLGLIESTDFKFSYLQTSEGIAPELPFYFEQIEYAPYTEKDGELKSSDWEDSASDWASAAHAGQVADLHAQFLTPLSDCRAASDKKFIRNASSFRIDSDAFHAELKIQKISEAEASRLASFLNDLFAQSASTENDLLKALVYKSTKAVSKSDQVLLVTHLPRASIPQPLDKGYWRP